MRPRLVTRAVLGLVSVALSACTEEVPPLPVDAGRRDAGLAIDAGEGDAGGPALDAGTGDGGADAASRDAGPEPPPGCTPAPVVEVASGALSAMTLSVAGGRALITWVETRDGATELFARAETAEGGLADERRLSDGATPRSPSAAGDDEGHWLVWTATAGGVDGYDLRVLRVDPAGAPGEVEVLEPGDGTGDHLPSVASRAGDAHVAWVRRALAGGGAPALARRSVGEPIGDPVTLRDDAAPTGRLALERAASRLVLAYLEGAAEGTFVHAMLADPSASTGSAPIRLSSDGRAAGGLDVASQLGEAAVVWDVYVGATRRELRFRQLDEEGAFLSAERPLTGGPTGGHTPSLVALAGGYLALFHGFGGAEGDHVRLALIAPYAEVIGAVSIEPLDGELIATALALDGAQVVAAWIERLDASDARLRAVRLLCNL